MNSIFEKKTILVGLSVFAVILFIIVVMVSQKGNVPVQPEPQTTKESKPLSNVDEVALQKQLQDILAKGKVADCATLSDERYQFACKDFFKIRKEK